jgi:hypothetical protein
MILFYQISFRRYTKNSPINGTEKKATSEEIAFVKGEQRTAIRR